MSTSILICGMEMPTTPVLFCIHPDGKVFADLEGEWREYKAVPVPPHGRCIDADALMKGEGRYIISFGKEGIDVAEINRAPTIIPASEECE